MSQETGEWKSLAAKACAMRDESMKMVDEYFPNKDSNHLTELPDPLPLNVTDLPKKYLTTEDYEIVETKPLELVEKIVAKEYTCLQVAGAYLRAAVLAQRLTNCVTQFLPQMAYERAIYLDEYLEKNGKPIGPFHGLPFSVKEHMGFAGLTQNRSITACVDNVSPIDAEIVRLLRDNGGANFHARTTEPQTYMCYEGISQIYGTTENPFNRNLTSGGSSSGEGAILGLHASSIGIGSDIGGSIRWPAMCQGQYGFKGTSKRLPTKGGLAFMHGNKSIPACYGPMSRDLESSIEVARFLIQCEPWKFDPELSGQQWNNEPLDKDNKKIRIGVLEHDGVVTPHPPVRRALEIAKKKLENCKFQDYEIELVPFKPYQHDKAWKIICGLYFEDGGEEIRNWLKQTGEPMLPLIEWVLNLPGVEKLDIHELWSRNVEKGQYQGEYLDHWNSMNIDVLLCPASAGAANPHGKSKYWCYASQWNLLDYPAVVFPVTAVDPAVDKKDDDYTPANEIDKFFYELYDPEVYKDAPVGLQIVGQRHEDEKVLEITKMVDSVLNK